MFSKGLLMLSKELVMFSKDFLCFQKKFLCFQKTYVFKRTCYVFKSLFGLVFMGLPAVFIKPFTLHFPVTCFLMGLMLLFSSTACLSSTNNLHSISLQDTDIHLFTYDGFIFCEYSCCKSSSPLLFHFLIPHFPILEIDLPWSFLIYSF